MSLLHRPPGELEHHLMNANHLMVCSPRGTLTHLSRHGELTMCGRQIPATWLQEPVSLERTVSCVGCEAAASISRMHQRVADGQLRPSDTYAENLPASVGNRCAHRICRTTEPCRYGNPDAPEDTVQLEEPAPVLPAHSENGTLLVVPCSGAKLTTPAPAAQLYRGTLTTMGLAAASVVQGDPETLTGHAGTRTMILSALHGLVDTDRVLAPYDLRMGQAGSVTTQQLADQLRAAGATRVVALTPNTYTAALEAACDLAGIPLVVFLAGCRGIGEQRGRLAQLRRSGGYGTPELGLQTRRLVQAHADALAEDRARTAAAVQEETHQQPVRCEAGHDTGRAHPLHPDCVHPHFVDRPLTPAQVQLISPEFAAALNRPEQLEEAPDAICPTRSSAGRRAALRQSTQAGRTRMAAAVRALPAAGTTALC